MMALARLEKWLRFVLATCLSGKPRWDMRGASLESTLERWEQATVGEGLHGEGILARRGHLWIRRCWIVSYRRNDTEKVLAIGRSGTCFFVGLSSLGFLEDFLN
jgi:hypothetical protein